jgi:hypothetical protein
MVDYVISGAFNKESYMRFMLPLSDLMRLGANKVLLRFDKATKSLKIRFRSENQEVISFIEFHPDTLKDFDIKEDVKLGIFDLSEFYSICKVFEGGFTFKYDLKECKIFIECQNQGFDHVIQYRPCDESLITKAPAGIATASIPAVMNFTWEPIKMALFVKGMGVIKYKNIVIDGKKDDAFVSLAICEKDTDNTTYKVKLSTCIPNTSDYKAAFTKDVISNIISSSIKNYEINLYPIKSQTGVGYLMGFVGSNDGYTVNYFINPIIAK